MATILTQGYSPGPDSPGHASLEDVLDIQDSCSAVLGVAPVMLFRQQFPMFANASRYTDAQVTMYLLMASYMVNCRRWGRMTEMGINLITAHFLALAALDASNPRGVPGTVVGVVNSGTVDKVSYGRDVASVMEENSGHWGMTTFGLQYLRFARLFGAGPVQVGWEGGWIRDPAFYLPQSNLVYLGEAGDLNAQAALANSDQAWPGVQPQNSPTF